MLRHHAALHRPRLCVLVGALLAAAAAQADVTVGEETSVDALIISLHLNSTERTTSDRQRRDSDGKMDGPLSFLAGSMRSAEIVRLDRELEWHLEPDKKRYRETAFPTAEQRALAQQKMQEMLDKLKQCPAGPTQARQEPSSGCEKSEPKFDVARTDETAVIVGHTARKTRLRMTYTCKDVKTGDTCDFVASSDLWLTDDTLPGYSERREFAKAHLRKLGLDDVSGQMAGQMRLALAPYMDQLKQLSARAGDLKGTPLRTVFSIGVGGAQCAAAKSAAAPPAGGANAGDNATGSGTAGQVLGSAASALNSKLLGGLFGKKQDPKPADPPAAAPAAAAGNAPKTLISFKTEATSISTDAIPREQFEIPPGWQKIEPKAAKGKDDEFQCPKTGG